MDPMLSPPPDRMAVRPLRLCLLIALTLLMLLFAAAPPGPGVPPPGRAAPSAAR